MKIALINNGTTLLGKLKMLLPENIDVFESTCENLNDNDYDLLILSGSSIGPLYENLDSYKKEIEIVKARTKATIGICFGSEIIAHAYGMTLEEMSNKEYGMEEFQIISNHPMFANDERFCAYENHQWKISEVSDDFEILAKSKHGPAIIKHKDLPIYGFQFHPENRTEKSDGDEIFLRLLSSLDIQ